MTLIAHKILHKAYIFVKHYCNHYYYCLLIQGEPRQSAAQEKPKLWQEGKQHRLPLSFCQHQSAAHDAQRQGGHV